MAIMKKLNVLVVLAIFIFSIVPMVLADEVVGTTEDGVEVGVLPTGAAVAAKDVEVDDTDDTTVDKKLKAAGVNKAKIGAAKDKVQSKIAAVVKDVNQKKRLIAQNKELIGQEKKVAIQKLNEKRKELLTAYKGIKARYDQAKKDYKGSREKVLEWKKKVQGCKEDENCTAKKEYRKQTKNHLVNLADVILGNLNKLQNQIEASEMDNTEQTELLSEIKTQIDEIKKAKTTLENKAEASEEDIKSAVQTIKKSWEKTKPLMKRGAGRLVNAKLGNLIVKVKQLETKFTQTRDRLKAKGEDVTKLDAALKSFKEKLDLAKTNWDLAKSKFAEAKTTADVNKVIKEAHAYQKKAREYITEAKKDLRDIMKEIKEDTKEAKAAAKEVKKEAKEAKKAAKEVKKEDSGTETAATEASATATTEGTTVEAETIVIS